MNDPQWTPGPWAWLDYPDGRKLLAGPGRAVIHCPDAPMGVTEADRWLIAAAPAMYEALRDAYQAGGLPREIRIKALRALVLAEEGGDS